MKKILLFILTVLAIMACKKEQRPIIVTPDYIGTYHNVNHDTLYVTTTPDEAIASFHWAAKNHNGTILFDSVKVNSDLTFTDNEIVSYSGNKHSIGIGHFGTNTVYFKFVMDGNATVEYSGVKQ